MAVVNPAAQPAIQAAIAVDMASREDESMTQRFTRGGRELWYKLSVLQQPERARACGSGQKAASDRRPVDPPPVIELKIFEGKPEDQKEITFDYNANFFLFASLQQARPIAHGRGMNPPPSSSPVLTGVPVAGMAYLDRPTAAGYFIFPDLSVRHEGHFKLTFSLYETTKEEKDLDREPTYHDEQYFEGIDWRMEVSTRPFSVFSAKKFPGLMESTNLSKCVADQGCRVRIRRDVRMRKRTGKGGNGGGGGNGARRSEDEAARKRTVTPANEEAQARARSATRTSDHQGSYYGERRPSGVEIYPPPPPPLPVSVHDGSSSRKLLEFGEANSHQYAAPHPRTQMIPASPMRPYNEPPHPAADHEGYYSVSRRTSESSLPPLTPRNPPEHHHRNHSNGTIASSASVYAQHADPFPRQSTYIAPSALASPARNILPPIHVPSNNKMKINQLVSPSSPPIEAQAEPLGAPLPIPIGGKRKHDHVFSQNPRSLYNGERQTDPHYEKARHGMGTDPEHGMYYRADGQLTMIQFPQWYTQ